MAGQIQSGIARLVRQFGVDTRGTTAVLFGMIAVPVLGLGLAALDYSAAQGTKDAIESAADAAAHAGAKMLGSPHSEIEDVVRGYLKTNLPRNRQDLGFVLTFAPDDAALTIKMNTSVPTSILGIVGVKNFAVAIESTVERPVPVTVPDAPSRRVAPELPDDVAQKFPGLSGAVPPEKLREAEEAARQILSEFERSGGSADMRELLRALGQLR